jgi:membrane-bound metal-dependent hydrolase YbcI (DUF457 family)
MIVDLKNTDVEITEEVISPDFPFKEIIKKQLSSATTTRESCYDYMFIHFEIEHSLPKYPFPKRVPVSMQYYFKKGYPIDFLLHIVNGYISILEIMNVAGEELIFNKSDVTKISFIYKNNEGDDVRSEYTL